MTSNLNLIDPSEQVAVKCLAPWARLASKLKYITFDRVRDASITDFELCSLCCFGLDFEIRILACFHLNCFRRFVSLHRTHFSSSKQVYQRQPPMAMPLFLRQKGRELRGGSGRVSKQKLKILAQPQMLYAKKWIACVSVCVQLKVAMFVCLCPFMVPEHILAITSVSGLLTPTLPWRFSLKNDVGLGGIVTCQ